MCGCDIFTLNTFFTARVSFLIPATCWDDERGERTPYGVTPTNSRVLFLIPVNKGCDSSEDTTNYHTGIFFNTHDVLGC